MPGSHSAFRRYFATHPWLVDSIVTLIYLVPMLGLYLILGLAAPFAFEDNTGPGMVLPTWAQLVFYLLMTLVGAAIILFRRRFTWLGFIAAWLVLIATFSLRTDFIGFADFVPLCILLYSLGVYESSKAAWLGLAVSEAGVFITFALDFAGVGVYIFTSLGTILLLTTIAVIGVNVGNRRRYVSAVERLAAQLINQQETRAQLAASRERATIAREMHDIVSHTMSVMIALADGARAAYAKKPEITAQALEQLADTGRDAMHDMRRILSVLRSDEVSHAGHAPLPSARSLPELIDSYRTAGLPVEADCEMISQSVDQLDDALSLVVYRVIQESLTNVLKHAPNSERVVVSLADTDANLPPDDNPYRPVSRGNIELLVRNETPGQRWDLPGVEADKPAVGVGSSSVDDLVGHGLAGHGLVGMAERVQAFGGQVESKPWSFGLRVGWQVRAVIPKHGSRKGA